MEKFKKSHESTCSNKKTKLKKYSKNSRTINRRNRRKRSKKAYFKMLRKERYSRGTLELCNSLQEFSVVDTPICSLNELPQEVIQWHNKDQVAYWKSRAICLELENKMLKDHLRNVYAQQIEYYDQNKEWQEVPPENDGRTIANEHNSSSTSIESEKKADKVKVVPNVPPGKHRLREMEKIYGDRAAKVMGMETALELNYQKLLEDECPIYWPNMPLKL
ncbi:unnamed protein product [Ceutorhynchus assimilis]|uniref:Uncharacterized protein n=1 Tax=Ceutorhynchus assimilis TaxID=467358 RepID=A0A9N9MNG9_9CUCU|nr:unnamed protein product [Ceutorhynchus assimilis]